MQRFYIPKIQKAKLLKTIQLDLFSKKILALIRQCPLPKNSPLCALNPYFDEDALIHIRERLYRACFLEATKNLIVLRAHPLLVRIIQHYHLRTMHVGAQLTLAQK